MTPSERRFADASTLAQALAADLAQRLRQAVAARDQALLAVSGGKSPLALFAALRQHQLPWSKVTITLVDERVVASDDADSNALLVRTHLLRDHAQAAHFVPLIDETQATLAAPEMLLERARLRWSALPHADLVVLGLGEDGHTASLFADAQQLEQGLAPHNRQRLLWLRPGLAPHDRLSMTLAEILAARHIVLSFGGAAKNAIYQRACAGADARWPVSHVLHAQHPSLQVWMNP